MQTHSVGSPVQAVSRGQYVAGSRGLKTSQHGIGLPGGAVAMAQFTPETMRRDAAAPMERPVMLRLRRACGEWYSQYLRSARGTPLADGETLPPLLLLVWALHHTARDEQYHALECMKSITFPMTTSDPVTVRWGHQPFTAVPYQIRHFPMHVATLILDVCRTAIFDDINVLWHERREAQVMRLREHSERVVAGYTPFREPTKEEQAQLDAEVAGIAPQTPVDMVHGARGNLLLALGSAAAKPTNVMPSIPPRASGGTSMPPNADPQAPPIFNIPGVADHAGPAVPSGPPL